MGITLTFVSFFSDLCNDPSGVSHQELVNLLPNEIPQLSATVGVDLIKELSKNEVF